MIQNTSITLKSVSSIACKPTVLRSVDGVFTNLIGDTVFDKIMRNLASYLITIFLARCAFLHQHKRTDELLSIKRY